MAELRLPDINNVLIAGNITQAPVLRQTANGTPVVNFYIASNRKYRDNAGVWRENICHVGVVAWHKLAETCAETLHVGSSVLIDGEMQSRAWKTEDGSSRSIVEIRARRIQFLEPSASHDVEETVEQQTKTPQPPKDNNKTGEESTHKHIEPTDFDFGYQDLKI